MKAWWNGRLVGTGQAVVPLDPAYFRGDAVAENLRVERGRVLAARKHHARLSEACSVLQLPSLSWTELRQALDAVLRANRLRYASLRLRYHRDGALLLLPMAFKPVPLSARKPLRLLTTAVRHYGPASLQGRVKAASMLNNWLAWSETQRWADDGLRLSPDGLVAEGVWTNIVMTRGRTAYSPPLSQGALAGTQRARLLAGLRRKGYAVSESPLTRQDLYRADQLWVCTAVRGALPVASVDGRAVGA